MAGEVVEPLGHHEVLLLFVQLFLLLVVARGLGELVARIDLPAVVGELLAGVVLGPSLFGVVAPAAFLAVFPREAAQFHLLEVVSWLGLTMLLILTGLETDLGLIARRAREATSVSIAGIAVPFALGFGVAFVLPTSFLVAPGDRLVFSLFVATALSISALPVIAKVLMDMDVIRRDVSQLTLAAGMVNDTIGWILLAVVAGLAQRGVVELGAVARTVIALVAVLGIAFTLGQRAADRLVGVVDNLGGGEAGKLSVLMGLAFGVGAVTHALGLEAVLGAFAVGVVFSRIERFDRAATHTFEAVTFGVFAPIFFATAGLRVDLTAMADPAVAAAGAAVLAAAVVGKFAGSYAGARVAGLTPWEGVTIGAGLNARGAMEIVVATIGLGLGVLTSAMYTIVVMVAIVTSIMAPPILRWSFRRVEVTDDERERLAGERRRAESFVENVQRVLLPTRCSPAAQRAAQVFRYLVADSEIEVTNMYVSHAPRRRAASPLARLRERLARLIRQPAADGVGGSPSTGHDGGDVTRDPGRCLDLMRSHEHPPTDRRVRGISRDPTAGVTATVLAEAERGYDLLAIGASRRGPGGSEPLFSTDVDDIVGGSPCPVLVVTAGTLDPETTILAEGSYDRVLLPTVGTEYSRHAAEIAFAIARNADAIVEVVNVVERTGDVTAPDDGAAVEIGRQIVAREADLGRQVGATVRTRVVRSDRPAVEILDLAAAQDADLIVMGTNVRPLSGKAFLGHRVEHVVTHADCPVAVVTST